MLARTGAVELLLFFVLGWEGLTELWLLGWFWCRLAGGAEPQTTTCTTRNSSAGSDIRLAAIMDLSHTMIDMTHIIEATDSSSPHE